MGGAGGAPEVPSFDEAAAVELVSPGERFNDYYGTSVAVSGDTVVVGAYRDYSSLIVGGAAHVFVRDGEQYELEASLRAQSPEDESYFAWPVAIDGDVVAAGARAFSDPANLAGAAYLLSRNGTSWVSQQRLQESRPQELGKFGQAVAVSGETALVSAPGVVTGHVYAYERAESDWVLSGPIIANDPPEQFGYSLALEGDTAVIGSLAVGGTAPASHVFVRDGDAWIEQGRLVPGSGADGFGFAVALSGDLAIVGSEGDDGPGGAFVFVRSAGSWAQEATLDAESVTGDDRFGASVAISGHIALVGAPRDDELGEDAGAVYVFVRNEDTWSLQTKLADPDPEDGARFGTSVALDGNVGVVGGVNDTTGRGRVTVFVAP